MDTLLNWVWQGVAVAVAAGVILRVSGAVSATVRHGIWWIAMVLVLVLPLRSSMGIDPGDLSAVAVATTIEQSLPVISIDAIPQPIAWTGLGLWCLWVATVGCCTGLALVRLRRLKRHAVPFPAGRALRLRHWRSISARGRRARLVLSTGVGSAAVLGISSPVIAVAPALLQDLDDDDLDRIVVHEWLHVQRRDDLTNVIQVVIRIVAGWHPAIWWIDRQLSAEREAACDERAADLTGSWRAYAACLTRLADLRAGSSSMFLAPGALVSSGLSNRVVRLVARRSRVSRPLAIAAASVATVSIGLLWLAVSGMTLVVTARAAARTSESNRTAPPHASVAADRESLKPLPGRRVRDGARTMKITSRIRPQAAPVRAASGDVTDARAHSGDGSAPTPPAIAASWQASPVPARTPPPVTLSAMSMPGDLLSPPSGPDLQVHRQTERHPWEAAAAAGVAVGRGSRSAAVATGGFFSRVSKKIAGRF